ncbi:CobW family GTP-binding protein [Homoserinibacter sp. YIM 151385]|uniref:CobW family GTP-binding protein n=1 Tax=Homoserinibacter sp. YIM 151385 TaxID=2985506 RepID=UPI0022F0F64C|nr:GTP-binding protein [Homoserinibacter sp. YIM 151385]WBU36722.1 GTP-binding protein [Homoserinibacter sp. YIM 151385]
MTPSAIPLIVVGGYLGSGKTTLIRDLLREGVPGTALIVNDFGELDVDAALLSGGDGDLVNFSDGCICCQASDGMSSSLALLRERAPRRVVVEASGVGDPAALAAWSTTPGFTPGGVIVCADATTISARLRDRWIGDTIARQLASADLIVVTHADVAREAVLDGALFLIGLRAPHAEVIVRRDGMSLTSTLLDGEPGAYAAPAVSGQAHAAHDTWVLRAHEPVDRPALERALRALPREIVRLKGFAVFAETPELVHTVQCVGPRFAITLHGPRDSGASALTVIAKPGASRELIGLHDAGLEPAHSHLH